MVQNHLLENSRAINKLQDIVERTSNDVKILVKHFQMVQSQIDQLTKVQKDLLVNAAREKKHVKYAQEEVLPLKTPYILKDILRGSSKILSALQVMIFLPRRRRRSIKQLQNPMKQVKILIVFLFLMLKLHQVMLSIKKKLKRNQKSLIRMQSTPKKTSLPTSMVKRENLGCRNQCLFLVRNTNPRKKNTTTGFMNG
jgi:hypothetical protein